MEPTEQEAPAQEAQEAQEAHAAPHAAPEAPEPKRRGREQEQTAAPPASSTKPFSVDHMLGPSFVSGGQQVFEFVKMMAHNEVYLRCAQLANASRVLGNLVQEALHVTGPAYDLLRRLRARTGQYI